MHAAWLEDCRVKAMKQKERASLNGSTWVGTRELDGKLATVHISLEISPSAVLAEKQGSTTPTI